MLMLKLRRKQSWHYLIKPAPLYEEICMGSGGMRERKSCISNREEMTDQSLPPLQAQWCWFSGGEAWQTTSVLLDQIQQWSFFFFLTCEDWAAILCKMSTPDNTVVLTQHHTDSQFLTYSTLIAFLWDREVLLQSSLHASTAQRDSVICPMSLRIICQSKNLDLVISVPVSLFQVMVL